MSDELFSTSPGVLYTMHFPSNLDRRAAGLPQITGRIPPWQR
jgi:hypothetical protein